ncbi:MAG: nucleotide exchange factor GrpE [Saprospiraceae bacterium]|nr:nucleotide exchange factor GrpE [Saprospiraceae bacterium]
MMINKIKEYMSNQVDETSSKKTKRDKHSENELALQLEVESLKTDLEESKDKYLRLFAEFDNFKKRSVKERFELMKTAAQETLSSLLPVLDDFDRAKKSSESGAEALSEGVQLVYHKLYSLLEHKGLKSMESTGLDFDPELHEAITDIPAPSEEMKGKVIDTVEKGYFLNDKIIRHAKVVIGK